jgi:UPF0755 protein
MWLALSWKEKVFFRLFKVLLLVLIVNAFWWAPPKYFSKNHLFQVKDGETLSQATESLYSQGFIKSKFWFKVFITLLDGKGIKAGDYFFEQKLSAPALAYRIIKGKYALNPIRITIPEGLTATQTAELVHSKFEFVDQQEFVLTAREGYLFPDTYFFLPNVMGSDVIKTLESNFDRQIKTIEEKVASSTSSLNEIITMASIIEEEAADPEDRRIISGILWKRIEIGMPLQVDATFEYVNGKNTYELTHDDLKIKSEYNTYQNKGLPPGPISNPSLDAIIAALEPTQTQYLYFLSDLKGKMYYAKDFDEHQRNRELYLRK